MTWFFYKKHSDKENKTELGMWWVDQFFLSHGTNFSARVVILFSKRLKATIIQHIELDWTDMDYYSLSTLASRREHGIWQTFVYPEPKWGGRIKDNCVLSISSRAWYSLLKVNRTGNQPCYCANGEPLFNNPLISAQILTSRSIRQHLHKVGLTKLGGFKAGEAWKSPTVLSEKTGIQSSPIVCYRGCWEKWS